MVKDHRRRPAAAGTRGWVIITLAVAAPWTATACSDLNTPLEYSERLQRRSIESGGQTRTYLAYVPSTAAPGTPAPLVLVLHGAHQTAEEMQLMSWMNAVGEDHGAVVVHPQAAGAFWATGGGSPPEYETVDDLGFMDDLVRTVSEGISIDPARVYVTGFSNGGLLAVRLACQDRERWAAVGLVGALIPAFWDGVCPGGTALPAIFIMGDQDTEFPFPTISARSRGLVPAELTLPYWAGLNGCDGQVEQVELADLVDDGTTIEHWTTPKCSGRQETEFYVVHGGGHTWPGSPINLPSSLGRKSEELDASRTLMSFFLRHSLP